MKNLEKDLEIVKFIEENDIDLKNPHLNVHSKQYILTTILGYKSLRVKQSGNKGKICPVNNCSYERITATVRKHYESSKKRLEETNY